MSGDGCLMSFDEDLMTEGTREKKARPRKRRPVTPMAKWKAWLPMVDAVGRQYRCRAVCLYRGRDMGISAPAGAWLPQTRAGTDSQVITPRAFADTVVSTACAGVPRLC